MDPFARRRQRFRAVLQPLGLWELFAQMPRRFQELYFKLKLPDPVLEFDASVPDSANYRRVRRDITMGFARAKDIEVEGVTMSVNDFLGIVIGLSLAIQAAPPEFAFPPEVRRFIDTAGPILQRLQQHEPAAMLSLYNSIYAPVIVYSRTDRRHLTTRMERPLTTEGIQKLSFKVVVSAVEPEERDVVVDNRKRPVYPVPTLKRDAGGVEWVAWSGHLVPGGDPSKRYPVCVQSHALHQLHERVNLPPARPYLEGWMAHSLAEPKVVARSGRDLLAEFHIRDLRIGYFVVSPLTQRDGIMLVRTFLFLTMENTPEGRRLHKRLRITRGDSDYLKLIDLATFTHTDLKDDPKLRAVLDQCGCGHLFELHDKAFAPQLEPHAAKVRRYLQLVA